MRKMARWPADAPTVPLPTHVVPDLHRLCSGWGSFAPQRAASILALLALLLTGCATGAVAPRTDTISFDRAQFAFMLAEVGQLIAVKCRDPKADKVECARLSEQYQAVRKQVMTPPAPSVAPAGSGIDIEMLLKLLGVFVGAAT